MEKEKEYIYFRESFLQSLLSDIISYGMLLGIIAANYYLFNNNQVTAFVLLVLFMILVLGSVSARQRKFTDKEELIKHIKEN